MDGPEPKTPGDAGRADEGTAVPPHGASEGRETDARSQDAAAESSDAATAIPVIEAPTDQAPMVAPIADAVAEQAAPVAPVTDAPAEPPAPVAPALVSPQHPSDSAIRTTEPPSERPQTTTIAPARSSPDRSQGSIRRAPSRIKTLLAILGSLAALGALVIPLIVRAGADKPPGVANAASLAGAAAAIGGPGIDDSNGSDAGDGGEPDEGVPLKPAVWRVARLADDPTVTLVEGTKGKRPLLVALGAAGLSRAESHRIVASLQDLLDLDHADAKDTFAFARDKATGRVVAFEVASSPIDVWQGREDVASDGSTRLVARKLELQSERIRIRKAVLVGADLRASLVEAGFAPIDDILAMLDDALEGHAELSDLRPGARLRIFATLERVDGAFVRWVSLDAVEYVPASPSAPAVRVYQFADDDHHHGWYDAKGHQPTHGGFRLPIPFARVGSPFNPHRMHPVLHVVMPHNGVDLRATAGTPVYSTAAGVVVAVGNDGPCGNKVEVSHAGGITSVYCHLSRFAPGLHVGEHVESRQLVAYVGQTGRVTGPHLHFGIKHNGMFIDPMSLRLDGMRVVPKSRRDEFDRLRASLDAELDAIPLPAPTAADPSAPKEPSEPETFYEEP